VRLERIEITIRSDTLAEPKSLGNYPTLKELKGALQEIQATTCTELGLA